MERSRKIIRVSIIGILVNIILVIFKAACGLAAGSISIILDAVNNLSDAFSSAITIIGTKLAGRAPDRKHPYGYGRIEYISSITIAIIILVAGFTSFRESFDKILYPEEADYTVISFVIISVAVVVKFLLGNYVKNEGKKCDSDSLVASGTDAIFDSVISISTIVAAVVSVIWHISIEGYLGAVIAVIIIKAGIEILLESLSSIIGERVDSELSAKLKSDIADMPYVIGAYDLILHRYGPERIIGSVHVELPDDMTTSDIHDITRKITEKIYNEYNIIMTVGIYASNTRDEYSANIKNDILSVIREYQNIIQMHGFYVDKEQMLITFDIVVDFKENNRIEVRDEIISKLQVLHPDYHFAVNIDSYFSD